MSKKKQTPKKSVKLVESLRGCLVPGEPHPEAANALRFLQNLPLDKLYLQLEAYSSCAIEGNRYAEILGETLRRLLAHEPVSDRYILGLAWAMRSYEFSV